MARTNTNMLLGVLAIALAACGAPEDDAIDPATTAQEIRAGLGDCFDCAAVSYDGSRYQYTPATDGNAAWFQWARNALHTFGTLRAGGAFAVFYRPISRGLSCSALPSDVIADQGDVVLDQALRMRVEVSFTHANGSTDAQPRTYDATAWGRTERIDVPADATSVHLVFTEEGCACVLQPGACSPQSPQLQVAAALRRELRLPLGAP